MKVRVVTIVFLQLVVEGRVIISICEGYCTALLSDGPGSCMHDFIVFHLGVSVCWRYCTEHHHNERISCSCEDEFVFCIQFNAELSVLANGTDGFAIITLTVDYILVLVID